MAGTRGGKASGGKASGRQKKKNERKVKKAQDGKAQDESPRGRIVGTRGKRKDNIREKRQK